MTAWRFTNNGKIVRRVTMDDNQVLTVDDAVNVWFGAQWVKTGRNLSGIDRSSFRRLRTDLVRYRNGVLTPTGGPLKAGDRVDLDGTTFEVLEDSRDVRIGRRTVALEVPVQDILILYPYEGALAEQGGDPVEASVRFAVYSPDETHEDTGTYADLQAEADIKLSGEVYVNRQFVSDGRVFKITASETDYVGKYVRMTVRKAGVNNG